MLSTALQSARHTLDSVGGLAAPPPPAGGIKAQLTASGNQLLPAVSATQAELRVLTQRGIADVDSLSQAVDKGLATATAVDLLHTLGTAFDAQNARMAPLVQQLDGFRDGVDKGVATMAQEQTSLAAQLAGLAAQREHWQAQADKINKQNQITNIIGAFIPFAPWAGGEIASEIQYGKSTEEALAEANQKLAQVAAQAQALQAAVNACKMLATALEQLASAVQSLANAVSLVRADLADDSVQAAVATPTTLKLFLIALSSGLKVLQSGAS
jgi:hypothetical protein